MSAATPHAGSRNLGNQPTSAFHPSQSLYLRYLGYPQTSYHRLRGSYRHCYSPLAILITPGANGQPQPTIRRPSLKVCLRRTFCRLLVISLAPEPLAWALFINGIHDLALSRRKCLYKIHPDLIVQHNVILADVMVHLGLRPDLG